MHKKKAAGPVPVPAGAPTFICDLCDISCTSKVAYEAHLRGIKHCKVCVCVWGGGSVTYMCVARSVCKVCVLLRMCKFCVTYVGGLVRHVYGRSCASRMCKVCNVTCMYTVCGRSVCVKYVCT